MNPNYGAKAFLACVIGLALIATGFVYYQLLATGQRAEPDPPVIARLLDPGNRGINAIALTPDGKELVAACSDGTVKLWDLDRQQIIGTIARTSLGINAIAISGDGVMLACAAGSS